MSARDVTFTELAIRLKRLRDNAAVQPQPAAYLYEQGTGVDYSGVKVDKKGKWGENWIAWRK